MGIAAFMDSNLFTFAVLPLFIFFARVIDVSMGTIRVIFISRGYKYWAPILGFFEVLIWIVVVRQVLVNLSNVFCFIAYAAGFAAGTFIGIFIEEKLSVGKVLVRIHIREDAQKLINKLLDANYPVVAFNAKNHIGKMKVLSIVVGRQAVKKLMQIVQQYDTHAVYSIEDVRFAIDEKVSRHRKRLRRVFRPSRKGK